MLKTGPTGKKSVLNETPHWLGVWTLLTRVWLGVLSSGCARTGDMFQAACPTAAVRKRNFIRVFQSQVKERGRRRKLARGRVTRIHSFCACSLLKVRMRIILFVSLHKQLTVQEESRVSFYVCSSALCVCLCMHNTCVCVHLGLNYNSNRGV